MHSPKNESHAGPDDNLLSNRTDYVQAYAMRILLVEDSPEVSLITVEYLTELGHQVVAVADAESAILELDKERFDVVMTDVSLPGMSGIDLAKQVVQHHPDLPVVIASGYGALNIEALLGQRQRYVMVLPKPYDMTKLEETLSKAATLRNLSASN